MLIPPLPVLTELPFLADSSASHHSPTLKSCTWFLNHRHLLCKTSTSILFQAHLLCSHSVAPFFSLLTSSCFPPPPPPPPLLEMRELSELPWPAPVGQLEEEPSVREQGDLAPWTQPLDNPPPRPPFIAANMCTQSHPDILDLNCCSTSALPPSYVACISLRLLLLLGCHITFD